MEDPELEAIRQRRMAELQQQAQNQAAQEEQAKRMEMQKQNALRQILTTEARQRLANIRLANPHMVIPLRAAKQAPRTRRAKRAIKEVREIVMRHMKVDAEHVWIDASVNEKVWENGIRNPPSKITVKAVKFDDGLVEVSLAE